MLNGGLHEIELAPVPVKYDKSSIHAHAVIPQLVQKQTNGATGWASGALPGRIGLVVGRGGGGQSAQQLGVHLGAIRTLVGVAGIDAVNKGSKTGMLGKVATQSHHPSGQNLCHRVEVRGSCGVKGYRVRGDMIKALWP